MRLRRSDLQFSMSALPTSTFLVFSFSFFLFFVYFCWACHSGDRTALIALSNELDSPIWSAENVSALGCCRWIGVTCSPARSSTPSSRRVVRLELNDMNLSGRVSSSLGRLEQLRLINLAQNNLSGPIPEDLFKLRHLEVINLRRNSFSGSLSPSVGNLSELVVLDLSLNNLSGNIPDAFHGLGKLETFMLLSNFFSGPLPGSLTSRSSLRILYVGDNYLSGSLGMNFTALSRLESLLLPNNYFTGGIPENISMCRNLRAIYLAGNELHGQIPLGLKHLPFLRLLFLEYNKFSNITQALLAIQECHNLEVIRLSGNFQKEEMPGDGIVGFPRLKSLLFDDSNLSGRFPVWLSRSVELIQLSLGANYLTGDIPLFLTRLKNLNSTKLQTDKVSTSCTSSPCFYVRITPALDLSMNRLSGNTWMLLSNLRQLVNLNLSHNSFSGSIPAAISEMKSLQYLDLSWNQISGTIPDSLTQLASLSYFCVSNNRLHGNVPTKSQFSTFPSRCFDGNPGLCYTGKHGCDSQPPSAIVPHDQDFEQHRVVDMGVPFAIGVSVGYATTFLSAGIYHYWRLKQSNKKV